MSATNLTPIINLPLFIGTDKPAWLVDWNGAMNIIDSSIAALQTAEGGTATALASLSQSVQALSGTVEQHTTALQTVTQSTAGNTGSINTINSLIGNGQPTTTDKTIIGAINEINAKIPEGGEVAADDVTYDNATSGLQATDVQAAIDELAQGGAGTASSVSYNNTTSGLTATNVQAAIDEVVAKEALNDLADVVALTANTEFVIPSDGYIDCVNGGNVKITGSTNTSALALVQITSASGSHASIFVRKGMKATLTTASGQAHFVALQ